MAALSRGGRRRTLRVLLAAPVLVAGAAVSTRRVRAAGEGSIRRIDVARFSALAPGDTLPAEWKHQRLPSVERPNVFSLTTDGGATVLRVQSHRSASTLVVRSEVDPNVTPLLRWRWWVANAVAGSDLRRKAGDDYAARLYVLFDLPAERLSVGDRLRIAAARLLHGEELPAAALCYVWGTAQAAGESAWNAYTDRVRMIVVDSGDGHAQQWRSIARDVAADFRAAFGAPVPRIFAIALAADTDNTGERSEARFGDVWFESHG